MMFPRVAIFVLMCTSAKGFGRDLSRPTTTTVDQSTISIPGKIRLPYTDYDAQDFAEKVLLSLTREEVKYSGLFADLQKANAEGGRQRFVAGASPLSITVQEDPKNKWSPGAAAPSQLYVEERRALLDHFQAYDPEQVEQLQATPHLSLELIGEVHVEKPGYVHVMPSTAAGSFAAAKRTAMSGVSPIVKYAQAEGIHHQSSPARQAAQDRLWVTGFSVVGQEGHLHSVETDTGHVQAFRGSTRRSILWPNESNSVPKKLHEGASTGAPEDKHALDDALLVSDGFLVPGKDQGGVYLVKNPGHRHTESTICLTGGPRAQEGWFYHRSVWVDLTGDGRKSILTCRAQMSTLFDNGGEMGKGQLVWLEQPKPHHFDDNGTAREEDGSIFDPFDKLHLPWKTRVLDEGPDVMFSVADLDTEDDTIEVIASNFFEHKVSLHSIQKGPQPEVVFRRTIDKNCGAAFSAILADLDAKPGSSSQRQVVDSGSTVNTYKPGDLFSHVLLTSHENHYKKSGTTEASSGSLYSYRVPEGKNAWKIQEWTRTRMASDFRVKPQIGNIMNPGAPGFVYAFHAKRGEKNQRPTIAVAGDCAESAYLFRPVEGMEGQEDPSAQYKLMCEIKCGATIGSIGVGYDDFGSVAQDSGFAKLYLPLFEKNKVLVFALGNGTV